MWSIVNRTPYQVGRVWGRDKGGTHEWIVAVKATYDIGPDGALALADEQAAPLLAPQYHGEPGQSSLRHDAELVAPKPTTDVIVNGTAYAPGGRPSADFTIGLRVGAVLKALRVKGDRRWGDGLFGGKPLTPQPVTQVPVVYERAYGGYDRTAADPADHRMDARNPVGCGLLDHAGQHIGEMLPNFEYLDGSLEKGGPAGFGALDGHWSPRREFTGTYDARWAEARMPLLPQDWDPRSLLCSPPDQQAPNHLRGGEPFELLNLTPQGRLRFVLPKVHLGFRTLISGRTEEHRSRLSTVTIEPDQARLIMVWVSALPCPTDVDYLEHTIVVEKPFIQ